MADATSLDATKTTHPFSMGAFGTAPPAAPGAVLRGAVPNGEKNGSGGEAPREPRLSSGEVGGSWFPAAPPLLCQLCPRQLEGRGKKVVGWA
jgi:hypothetical protein